MPKSLGETTWFENTVHTIFSADSEPVSSESFIRNTVSAKFYCTFLIEDSKNNLVEKIFAHVDISQYIYE